MTIEPLRDRWEVSASSSSARTPARDLDLVITREVVRSMPRYVVQRQAGPPQLQFASRQAALDAVAVLAEREAVDVRYRTGRTSVVLARAQDRCELALSAACPADGWRRAGDDMVVTKEGTVDWRRLVCGEYREMPGLSLTRPQVQRLWGLDQPTSEALLGELVHCGFLRLTEKGTYVRAGAA